MKKETKIAAKEFGWTMATCGLYLIVIFLRVLFTTKTGQVIVEEKIEGKIKAFTIDRKEEEDA